MSDLQEMIHKTSMAAHVQGVMRERERILEILAEQSKRYKGLGLELRGEDIDFMIFLIKQNKNEDNYDEK